MRTQKGPPLTPRSLIAGRSADRALTRFFWMSSARSRDSWTLLFWTIFWRIDFISPMFLVEVAFSAGGQLDDRRVGADVQEERLDAAALAVPVGVGVDGHEQVGPLLVGDDRPVLEGDVDVRFAGQDGVEAGLLLEQLLQGQGDVQVDRPSPGARSCRSSRAAARRGRGR